MGLQKAGRCFLYSLLFQSSVCCDSELIVPSSWHLPITSYFRISWDFTYSKAISQPSGACCTVQRSFSLGTAFVSSSGGSECCWCAGTVDTAATVPASACSPQPCSMETKIFTQVHGFDSWPCTGAGVGLYLTTGFYILPLPPWP